MRKILGLVLLFFLIIITNSCNNYKYLYRDNIINQEFYDTLKSNFTNIYHIQPYDYLYISIKSTNQDINEMFSRISSEHSAALNNNESNFFLTGYLVNDSGFVFIPTLGNLYVQGKTVDEARRLIEDNIHGIISDAVINVRLASFNITFLGEVGQSGRIQFYKEKINILEALATAGGITDYGNKRHIKVIRQQNDEFIVYDLDLTNIKILESANFYMHPNDIVYVPDKGLKSVKSFLSDYGTLITILTSTITTTLLIIQLTKPQ